MRPKSLVLLALALGCGLVASIGISQVMENRTAQPGKPVETETVLVALRDIERSERLSPENVALKEFPKGTLPPSAIRKIDEVEGLRPNQKLVAGEMILSGKVGASENSPREQIPQGFRVATVRVDATTGGAGLIQPGDRVDVQVYARRSADVPESGTWTFLQDVSVFAVNSSIHTDPDNPNQSIDARTISLLCTPEQAAKVTLASEVGRIRLVLRGSSDDTEASEYRATWSNIIGGSEKLGEEESAPIAAPLRPTTAPAVEQGIPREWIEQQPAVVTDRVARTADPAEPFEMVIHDGHRIRVMQFREGETMPSEVMQGGRHMPVSLPGAGHPPGHGGAPGLDYGGGFSPSAGTGIPGNPVPDTNWADEPELDEPIFDEDMIE